MIEVFDRDRRRVAILENAYGVKEDQKINALWYLEFTLPENDPKNEYCKTFYYVRYNDGELYRIMPKTTSAEETGANTYKCEHVLATLLDNVMFGYHVVGNIGYYTRKSVEYVLSKQITKNWVLGDCEFSHQFEYGWESENLLAALFSIATPFASPYIWVTDTHTYPWKIHLRRLNEGLPECYIMLRRNLLSYQSEETTEQICTRLYPLGYGEGVNQLGISEINNGKPYIQSPKEITDKYGIVERVWIDRRYESAESLLAAAKKMLTELQEPVVQYDIGYQEIDEQEYEKLAIGKRVQIRYNDTIVNTVVTELSLNYDEIVTSSVKIANKSTDIAETVADLADRQRIEMAYAQGATQLYAQSLQANCDANSGAVMSFYIPAEMRIVNAVKVKIKGEAFRAYSKATSTRQSQNQTSSSGGGSSQTSSSGGGGATTSGGTVLYSQNAQSDDYGGAGRANHNHGIASGYLLALYDQNKNLVRYDGFVASGAHTHGEHSHSVSIPSHTHSVSIPSHTHTVTIPAHDHTITPGIYRFGSPKQLSIYVNGVYRQSVSGTNLEVDITDWLVEDGKIPRGTWHEIEVRPNDLAYIMIDMYVQGFVQSRGDSTV